MKIFNVKLLKFLKLIIKFSLDFSLLLSDRLLTFFLRFKSNKVDAINKSVSCDNKYPELALNAALNANVYKVFRRHHHYIPILEHVDKKLAMGYLDIIRGKYNLKNEEILEIIKPLQYIGMPKKMYLSNLPTKVSTTSLRYLKIAYDIRDIINSNSIGNVVEIGCGYGGQAIILNQILDINTYTFLDLWQVNMLIRRFIEDSQFNIPYRIKTLNEIQKKEFKWDFLISNYAFSEIPKKIQKIYLEKIILNSKHGYMIMNTGLKETANRFSYEELKKIIPDLQIIDEKPLTGMENYLLIW